MTCDTCGIDCQDGFPHHPGVCAAHAGAELKKSKKALDGALETISKLKLERRGLQLMARNIAQGWDPGFWMAAMEDGKYERVGGDAPCPTCGIAYVEHPELPSFPTFHMICSGDIVKT